MNLHKTSTWTVRMALFTVGTLSLTIIGCADIHSKEPQPPVWAHEVSDVPVHPDVVYGQLENGMRYALMENDTPSNQAVLRLQVAAGSIQEEENEQGLAHFIEHMAFNGTTHVPEGDMMKILERKGLAFGADTNASTGYDYTTYMLNLPETDEGMIDTTLFLMRETASEMLFDQGAIDRERGVIQSEKRTRKSPGSDAGNANNEFMVPHARTNSRSPIGKEEVFLNAPRARFVDFYEKYYTPKRTILVMVGDFDAASVEKKIKAVFSDWKNPKNPGIEPDRGYITDRGLVAGSYQHKDIPTRVSMAVMRAPTSVPDSRAERTRGLAHRIASIIVNQRLAVRSREKDAPFFGAGVNYSLGDATGRSLSDGANAGASATPKKWREALGVVEQEVRRALQHGFTQAEVDEQIANMRASRENSVRRQETISSRAYVGAMLGAYDGQRVFTTVQFNLEQFNVAAEKVTPEKVWAAFQEQWKGAEPRLFVSSNEKVTKEELIAAYKASQAVAVASPEQVEDDDFAYRDVGTAGTVVWRDEIKEFGIVRARFDNNVMVNIKQTDLEKDRIRVVVRIAGGRLSLPEGKTGLNRVVDSSFIGGGLEAHDMNALQRLTAGHSVGMSFGIGRENFLFSGGTIPEDLPLQLQLWVAYMQHAAWRPEGLAKMHVALGRGYKMRDSSAGSVLGWELPPLLYSGDPRWRVLAEEEMRALTIADARAWIEKPLATEAIEIGIVGDIDPDVALAEIAKTFGALPKREAKFRPYTEARVAPKFPGPNHTPHILYHKGAKDRAVQRTYWPTTDAMDDQTSRLAELVRAVFQLKVTEEIREKQAGTYSPRVLGTMSPLYKGYGYMAVSLDVVPGKVAGFFEVVDAIAAELVAGNISDDELERARAPKMEALAQAVEKNGYWMNVIHRAQSHEEDMEEARTDMEGYRNITIADLRAFASKYLTPERAWRVKVIPEVGN